MKKLFVLLAIAIGGSSAWATPHLDKVCRDKSSGDISLSENYVSRQAGSFSIIESSDGQEIFSHHERVLALAEEGESLWALTNSAVWQISRDGEVLNRHSLRNARRMALGADRIALLDGAGQALVIDKESGEELWRSSLSELQGSKAVAAAYDGENFLFVATGVAQGGFNGIATVSSQSGEVLNQVQYNYRRAGVIFPLARAKWNRDHLIINNGGWIHQISAKQLKSKKAIMPTWIPFRIQASGNVQAHFMMLKGDFTFNSQKNLLGCGYSHQEAPSGGVQRVSSLFTVEI